MPSYSDTKYLGSNGADAVPVMENAEIRKVLNEFEKEVFQLEENLRTLAGRLAPISLAEVARPAGPNINSNSVPHSEIFNHILSLRVKMTDLNIYLSDIKQRLEL